ncbi:MAG: ABC transporter substrate-binding protein [Elusimicrobiales bacterium]|nr:ABC transporter substrate-binding protein [Elusimicrobiales bacterium]
MKKIYLPLLAAALAAFSACSKKPAELVFSVGGAPNEIEVWERIIKRFSEEKGVPASLLRQPTDSDQRRQGLLVPLKSEKANPDVFLADIAWIGQFAASGWLEDLAPYAAKDGTDLKPFWPKVVDFADRYNGQLSALPAYVDAGLLYYRTDLLNKYGFKAPPATWPELLSVSLKIQAGEKKANPDFFGFVWQGAQYEGLVCDFLEFASSGEKAIAFSDGVVKLDTPENIRALTFMRDTIAKNRISPPNTYTEMKEEEVRTFFQEGKAAFERNWPYAWGLHQQADSPVKGKVGIAPMPRFPGGTSVSTLGGWHIAVSRFSDDKAGAWELVKYITSPAVQKELALELGWNPGRMDVYSDKEVLKAYPHFAHLEKIFANAYPRPNIPYYTQVSSILQRHLNSALSGASEPGAALKAAESEMNEAAARYR